MSIEDRAMLRKAHERIAVLEDVLDHMLNTSEFFAFLPQDHPMYDRYRERCNALFTAWKRGQDIMEPPK